MELELRKQSSSKLSSLEEGSVKLEEESVNSEESALEALRVLKVL